ncbi:response regulator [Dyadobacter psychrotolerans]|uniref:Sensory/regulatory protein RpfC n=1 Tax=Dyadobacter psychrotolerans TaxID=2541721 RepID=A0A4R5DBR0_9BACT|nr:response regulator [Dyadobacter psychrotolerans]TDE09004.1 response regulator [Dyadobacter psychrotolerans]
MVKGIEYQNIRRSKSTEFSDHEKDMELVMPGYAIMDAAIRQSFDDLAELLCLVCDAPTSLIVFINPKGLMVKIGKDAHSGEMTLPSSFCEFTMRQGSFCEIADLSLDYRFESNELVGKQAGIRFYAGYPLIDHDDNQFGSVCVLDYKVRKLDQSQIRSLQLIASQAIALIKAQKNQEQAALTHHNDNLVGEFNKDSISNSEEKLKSFFENSQGLMCTHDLDGNFTAVNSVGAGLLGYTVEQILEMNLRDLTPLKHRQGLEAYLHQVRYIGRSSGLITTVHKDGHHVIWSYRNALVKELNGQDYIVGNCIDITQSHNQAKELHKTQQMLMQTNKIAGVGGWEFNLFNREFYWSELARQIYQEGADFHLDTETVLNFYKAGDSRDRVAFAISDAIANGTAHDLEVQIVNSESQQRWVRVVVNAEFVSGQCKRLYGTVQDIDEKKKTEIQIAQTKVQLSIQQARLLAFVEHIPAVVAMLDNEARYLVVSRKWEQEYGLAGKDVIGKSHYEIFENTSQHWKDRYQHALSGKGVLKGEDVSRPQGWEHDKYLSWEVWPWYQFDSKIGGIISLIHDVTETELRGQELKNAREQAEHASMAKSEFLANMSHEIRTPLNGVIGFTDLMLKTHMSDTQKQYLGIVNQSANTLLSIINDILDFSKIEAGKLELDIARYDIYEIAAQTADIISFQVQRKGLEMLLDVPCCLPRFVWVDDIRLKQVLINLLSNAAKFTESGEIELKIEVLKYEPQIHDAITCRFIVRDTGIGIREEKRTKIFEAFLQEDGSTTKKYGGTGLGLTISNQLLALMGSSLQLESVHGVGSTLFFDLNMKCEQGDAISAPAVGPIANVLIVDDNANNGRIMQRMLNQLNIKSYLVDSGLHALDTLAGEAIYNAVLMDYHMPHLDGLQTIRQIRKNFSSRQLPIILMNSTADDAIVLKASEELQINLRLTKPIRLEQISKALASLVHKESGLPSATVSLNPQVFTRKISVLVAEDHLINMLLAKTLINKIATNATILEVANGKEALELCQKQLPDLIFIDIQMPLMNGHEATSLIRKLPGADKVFIVALTAGNVMGEKEKCIEAGMDDFISKPFVQDAIWEVFQRFENLGE